MDLNRLEALAALLMGVRPDEEGQAAPSHSPYADRRRLVAERLRESANARGYGGDVLLSTLASIHRQRLELDAAARRILAYAREFVEPRPYRLVDLAEASGMSVSGVRTAYDDDDIENVARILRTIPGGGP